MNMHPAPLEAIYIHGSPPCQGWSLVNTSGGVNDTQNNKCTLTFLNAILHFQPKFVSMENVPGLLRKGLDVLRKVMAVLVASDYQVQLCELEATDYGDAQTRKRIILLASKKGWQLPSIPAATHGPGLLPKRTSKDAIGDLEKIEPTETGRVHLDGGKEIYDHYMKGTELGSKLDKVTVLDANEAAGTIRKQNSIMHYLKHRYITARERSR
jgi:DNA (cytosine-5)-methyltransferase 1